MLIFKSRYQKTREVSSQAIYHFIEEFLNFKEKLRLT